MTGSRSKRPIIEDIDLTSLADRRAAIANSRWPDPQFARAITDMRECRGTNYIEVCPERLKVKACWNPAAIYLKPETFELLEPILQLFAKTDQWAFVAYDRQVMEAFGDRLAMLSDNLASAENANQVHPHWFSMPWLFPAEIVFEDDFEAARSRLLALTSTLSNALKAWLETSDTVHVLGL